MTLPCEIPSRGAAADQARRSAATVPTLTTARLCLRAPRIGDFDTYARIVTGPRGAHLAIADRAEAWRDFAQMTAGWMLRGHGLWSVEDREGSALLGFVLLGFDHEDPEPELGYVFTEEAEGRGLATEAAAAARDFAFGTLGWPSLASFVAPDNRRSRRLAERLGARLEGEIGAGATTLVYRHFDRRGQA